MAVPTRRRGHAKQGQVRQNTALKAVNTVPCTVMNSILGRNVVVKKGAVIKNSIISSGCLIGENTHIENAIVDRDAKVIHINELVGTLEDPIYVKKGDII